MSFSIRGLSWNAKVEIVPKNKHSACYYCSVHHGKKTEQILISKPTEISTFTHQARYRERRTRSARGALCIGIFWCSW